MWKKELWKGHILQRSHGVIPVTASFIRKSTQSFKNEKKSLVPDSSLIHIYLIPR